MVWKPEHLRLRDVFPVAIACGNSRPQLRKWWNWRARVCGTKKDTCQFNLVESSVMPNLPRPSSNQWILIWMPGLKETRMSAGHTAVLSNKHENLKAEFASQISKPQGTEQNWQMESDWVQTIKAVHRKDRSGRLHYRELFKEVFLVYRCITDDAVQFEALDECSAFTFQSWKERFSLGHLNCCSL